MPWRVAAGVLGVAAIIYVWSAKDMTAVYSGLPAEAIVPMLVTNVVVTLLKVATIAAVVWAVKWLAKKIAHKQSQGE